MMRYCKAPRGARWDQRTVLRQLPGELERRLYAEVRLAEIVLEAVDTLMRDKGLSRADLAKVLGVTARTVHRRMRNITTLRQAAELLYACGAQVHEITVAPFGAILVRVKEGGR